VWGGEEIGPLCKGEGEISLYDERKGRQGDFSQRQRKKEKTWTRTFVETRRELPKRKKGGDPLYILLLERRGAAEKERRFITLKGGKNPSSGRNREK